MGGGGLFDYIVSPGSTFDSESSIEFVLDLKLDLDLDSDMTWNWTWSLTCVMCTLTPPLVEMLSHVIVDIFGKCTEAIITFD